MELFWDDPYVKIFCGDARELSKAIPEDSIDAVITDPPFMISSELKINRQRNPVKYARKEHNMSVVWKFRGKDINYNFGDWDFFSSKKEFYNFTDIWVKECLNILKAGGNFISYFDKAKVSYLYDLLESNRMTGHGILTHIISNPVPQARKVKFMQGTYSIVWASKKGARHTFNYQEGQHPDYIKTSICEGAERIRDKENNAVHPTQKPIAAMKWLIRYLTKPGDVVLDLFAGTGTTLVAAKFLGRKAIGIEINPAFCKVAKDRVMSVSLPFATFDKFESNNSQVEFDLGR